MDDRRKIERLFEFDLLVRCQGTGQGGEVGVVAGEGLLKDDLRLLHGLEQGDQPRPAEGSRGKGHGPDHAVGAHRVGNQIPDLVIVSKEIAEQVFIGPANLRSGHRPEALQKLTRLKELSAGSGSDLKTLGRIDLVKPQEQTVVRGLLGMGKDVVAPHPAEKDETDEQEDEDGPSE